MLREEFPFWSVVSAIYFVFVMVLMVNVMLKNRDSVKTLAWMLVFIFLPFVGGILYFFFGRDWRREKMIGRRLLSQIKQRELFMGNGFQQRGVNDVYEPLLNYFYNASSASALPAEVVEVLPDTDRFVTLLLDALDKAKDHIHIQFYIFEDDALGRMVRDKLVEKASQGVEVRLIYDSVGCWRVNKAFYEEMRCAGIYVESFLKVRFPIFTNKVNFRNHRKVVVIDGVTGFVGGCNIADRYVKGVEWGVWRDTMLMIRGKAVRGLQSSFLIDWYFSNRSLVSGERYFPLVGENVGALVQVVQSNPVGEVRAMMGGLVKLLSLSRNYIYMQTPYFMPDESFLLALKSAAISGVDVRLMVPERSDSKISQYASMSYFGDLLKNGVKIYLYSGGFLHSKAVVCDDYVSSVGSVNLDFRSFYHNFEISAFVYDKLVAHRLKENFMDDMKKCRQLTDAEYRGRPLRQKWQESLARLFSPLL